LRTLNLACCAKPIFLNGHISREYFSLIHRARLRRRRSRFLAQGPSQGGHATCPASTWRACKVFRCNKDNVFPTSCHYCF
jgi:hypothetical protein